MQKTGRTKKISRKYERYLMDQRLIVRATGGTLHGRTKNLAEGGMAATVAGDVPLGELVELEFQPPGLADALVLRAEVRYRHGFQYGFKFLPLPQQQVERIRRALGHLQPDPNPPT